jgi:rod shape determining protein RodA
MRRFSSFRDFDWMLLTLVLLLSSSACSRSSPRPCTPSSTASTTSRSASCWSASADVPHLVIDYHRLVDIAPWAYGISLVDLVAGQSWSARRCWARALDQPRRRHPLPALGVGQAGADPRRRALLLGPGRPRAQLADIGKAFALVCIPMALVLKQPDLGTALTYFRSSSPASSSAASASSRSPSCFAFAVIGGGAWLSGKRLKPYQMARLTSFINPDSRPQRLRLPDPQSLIAVGSGGLWGKGTNKGTQTQGDFLPIPYTDFIFAAFCEEHGFVGGIGVLLLYFLILMRLIQNAQTGLRHARRLHHHGGRRRHPLPDRGQRRDGRRPDAGHRHPAAADELRRIVDPLHLPRARHRDEHPHAPVCELGAGRKSRTMSKEIYISSTPHETRLAIVEDEALTEIYYERENEYTLAGSIYNGRVTRVLPGMQSSFVDIGLERDAFLYITDFMEEAPDPDEFDTASNRRPHPAPERRRTAGREWCGAQL